MTQLFPLDEARADYEKLKVELENAERDLALAIKACSESHHERDKTWFEYVRYATPANYDKFASALDALHLAYDRCGDARLNHKLIKCKFKKASKLYAKLQKRAAKQNKQFGEE